MTRGGWGETGGSGSRTREPTGESHSDRSLAHVHTCDDRRAWAAVLVIKYIATKPSTIRVRRSRIRRDGRQRSWAQVVRPAVMGPLGRRRLRRAVGAALRAGCAVGLAEGAHCYLRPRARSCRQTEGLLSWPRNR